MRPDPGGLLLALIAFAFGSFIVYYGLVHDVVWLSVIGGCQVVVGFIVLKVAIR